MVGIPTVPGRRLRAGADDLSRSCCRSRAGTASAPIDKIEFTGLKNYETLFTKYPPFWPALTHNLIWLAWFLFIATPLGMFMAVLLDKNIRGTRIYQSALYLPVVLSLAIIGFIWQLQYSPTQGLINGVLGTNQQGNIIDWLGNKNLNLWAVLVAASWRQVGYVMILYLAGLKAFDPSLREAAQLDGANERQMFFRVVFPVLKPINIVILVITIIESLRAFDLVYIINQGPERAGAAVRPGHQQHHRRGTAASASGRPSRWSCCASPSGPIIWYLTRCDAGGGRDERRRHRARHPRAGRGPKPHQTRQASRGAARVPHRASALVWLFPIAYAVYTSFRPYAETQPARATPPSPRCLQPRQLRQRLEPGGAAALLPEHGHHRGARRSSSSCSSRRWPRS